jgi:hypothetical protein
MTKSWHSLKQAILITDEEHDTSTYFSYELDNRNVGAHSIPGDGLGRQNDFRNNGERSIGEDGAYMGSIMLNGNRFEECDLRIAIRHALDVILKDNVFENVATPYALKPGDETKVIEK